MNVYFISGMAADERVFQNIILPPGFEIHYLQWITPMENESLNEYAVRLSKSINSELPFILIGVSMGGMMAVEVAKTLKPEKLILISSVPVASDLPAIYRKFHKLKTYKFISPAFLKNASVLKKFFGKYSSENRKLLIKIIRESDSAMIRWSVKAIGGWGNKERPVSYFHIHGNNDNVLPSTNTNPTHIIEGGRHFMILEKSQEINKILAEILLS